MDVWFVHVRGGADVKRASARLVRGAHEVAADSIPYHRLLAGDRERAIAEADAAVRRFERRE